MSKKIPNSPVSAESIAAIRFLVLDVDGVMTDGSITYTSSGEEVKSFNVKDGSGIKYWHRVGYRTAIVTGRSSPMVEHRARELGIELVEMGAKYKLPALERVMKAAGVDFHEVAVLGDDLPDIPMITRVGLGMAVADAVEEVKDAAAFVTQKEGGRGAVREAVEHILKSQGRWSEIMQRYL